MKAFVVAILSILTMTSCKNSNSNKMTPQNTAESTSGFANVNGLKMYYEIHGTGEPLVLIHGGGSTIETTFGSILPELAENNTVIAVEMQAHGHTADRDKPLSFEQDADDIAALLKELKIQKANILGFSNGGTTTLQFAIRHPEMTNKIIVASSFYKRSGAPDWFWPMMNNPTFEGMPQPFKEAFLKINPDPNALRQMYKRDVARMQSFTDITDEQMKSIKAPALIIMGDKDVVTTSHAAEMQNILSGARLAILPGGHGDYIGEITTPQDKKYISATVAMITKFLNNKL
jgi:pimeloyl-ACP methyl ester carboxylesterase